MTELQPDASGFPLFDAAISDEVVNARMGAGIDPRFRQVMATIVRHLHEAVKEIQPTHDEWTTAIKFLTDTGHMCTDWRQEFILLSDVLGVSMLVESLNHRRKGGATENTVLGPFYVANAPRYPNGADIRLDGCGEAMVVSGRVLDDQNNIIPGATIEVWQTNDSGFYDVQQADIQPRWNLRGTFTSDDDGSYAFVTAKPRHYPIPDDGPVGKLLHSLGRHPNRAAHIHFIVTASGFDPIITHIFDPNCRYLSEDAVFGVKPSLVASIERSEDAATAAGYGIEAPFWCINWDFCFSAVEVETAHR